MQRTENKDMKMPFELIRLFAFFVFSLATCFAFSAETEKWTYFTVSENDVLHEDSDKQSRVEAIKRYEGMTIQLTGQHLEIPGYCSAEIARHDRTPTEHWMSKKSAQLYSMIFEEENIPLEHVITEIEAVWPADECQPPFDTLFENRDFLVAVLPGGYLLFFKKN